MSGGGRRVRASVNPGPRFASNSACGRSPRLAHVRLRKRSATCSLRSFHVVAFTLLVPSVPPGPQPEVWPCSGTAGVIMLTAGTLPSLVAPGVPPRHLPASATHPKQAWHRVGSSGNPRPHLAAFPAPGPAACFLTFPAPPAPTLPSPPPTGQEGQTGEGRMARTQLPALPPPTSC